MTRLMTYPLVASTAAVSLPVVVDSAAKGCLLIACSAVAVLFMRRTSASTRHLVWALGLVCLLVLPAAALLVPQWRVLPSWMDVSQVQFILSEGGVGGVDPDARSRLGTAPGSQRHAPNQATGLRRGTGGVDASATARSGILTGERWQPAIDARRAFLWFTFGLWLTGALMMCGRLMLSSLFLSCLVPGSAEVSDGPVYRMLLSLAEHRRVGRPVRLFVSNRRQVPMTWGIRTPKILLPGEAFDWTADRLRAVLLHELAHVKRRDTTVQLLIQLACALHWFNPLVWMAARRARQERESACDDLVLSEGVKPSAYASHLVAISTGYEASSLATVCALAMSERCHLEGRLRRILDARANHGHATRLASLLCCVAATAVLLPISAMRAGEAKLSDAPSTPPDIQVARAAQDDAGSDSERALKALGAEIERNDEGRIMMLRIANVRVTDADMLRLGKLNWADTREELEKKGEDFEVVSPALLLKNVHITDGQVRHLETLTRLRSLSLAGNDAFSDAGLNHLQSMTNLETLWLDGTGITDAGLKHLQPLVRLERLNLGETAISGEGLAELKELPELVGLDVSGTRVTDAGLAHLKDMPSLKGIDLRDADITDAGLLHLKELTHFEWLELAGTKITDDGLVQLTRLTKLWLMDLDRTGITDAGLAHLKGLTKLESINIGGTRVTGSGLVHLDGLTAEGIDLGETDLTDEALVHLRGLPQLKWVELKGTDITDASLAHLAGIADLTGVNLRDTDITDQGLAHLKGLKKLEWINLEGTDVSEDAVREWKEALPNCQIRFP